MGFNRVNIALMTMTKSPKFIHKHELVPSSGSTMVDGIFFFMFLINYLVVLLNSKKCDKSLENFINMASCFHSFSGPLTAIPHVTTKASNSKVFRHLVNSPTCIRLN